MFQAFLNPLQHPCFNIKIIILIFIFNSKKINLAVGLREFRKDTAKLPGGLQKCVTVSLRTRDLGKYRHNDFENQLFWNDVKRV